MHSEREEAHLLDRNGGGRGGRDSGDQGRSAGATERGRRGQRGADRSPYSSTATTSAAIAAQSGYAYLGVSDSGFAPTSATVNANGVLQYNFYGPAAHTVVDTIGGCTSPSRSPISDYQCRYTAGGSYTVKEDGAATHTATVLVKDLLSATTVTHGTAVTITAATASPRSGWGFGVEILKPGGAWTALVSATTTRTASYTPATAGTYQFRSRLRDLTTSAASGYGPAVSLTVH